MQFILKMFLIQLLLSTCTLKAQQGITYMPLGDSYTIGEGLPANERFPDQLVAMLQKDKRQITLGPNPSVTGWTTQQLIDQELPLFKKTQPQLATLLIGVNDWVQEVPADKFRSNFKFILEEMIKVLPAKNRLVVLTIPDFSATPEGKKYGRGRDISKGIAAFNAIIQEECKASGIIVVDIYADTQEMKKDSSLISEDGLHPSAKEYTIWASKVYPYFNKKF